MKLEEYADILTVKETAEILKMSENTIKTYVNQGKILGYRYVREIRIDKQSVIDFLEESKVKPKKSRSPKNGTVKKARSSKNGTVKKATTANKAVANKKKGSCKEEKKGEQNE